MRPVPNRFRSLEAFSSETWSIAKKAEGYLSEGEGRFLMAAVALSPALGANIEIGSFKGRSTICIARTCQRYDLGKLVAIDPHTSPASTDPSLRGQASSFDDFERNVREADVADVVQAERKFSHEVGSKLSQPIRFLWIDGDHTYEGARSDVLLFRRWLAPGAVLAMHDVLGTHYGSLRTFVEEILDSNDFGPAGFCGSIGWAQYCPGKVSLARSVKRRLLAIPARQIIPVAKSGRGLVGINKLRYKFWRPLAPHGPVNIKRLSETLSAFTPRFTD